MASTNGGTEISQADKNVEMWRIKKLIKSLESYDFSYHPSEGSGNKSCKTCHNVSTTATETVYKGMQFPQMGLLFIAALVALLADDSKFGFIVVDGNGALFGTLSGNTREVLHKFTVELPKKHGRGGQSALRFARLRMEKRHNYVRKSDMFDQVLQAKLIKIVDISYGGETGFNQAIELATDALTGVKFIQEKKLIQRYFDEISQDSGKYCFGVDDTLKSLEMGAVETLIVWENLSVNRYVLKMPTSEENRVIHLRPDQETDRRHFIDPETGSDLEILDTQLLLDWLALNYRSFGTTLEIVTDKSQEGAQFVRGFGGIGGEFATDVSKSFSITQMQNYNSSLLLLLCLTPLFTVSIMHFFSCFVCYMECGDSNCRPSVQSSMSKTDWHNLIAV
ncbi:unnamed protein product [Trichobilharzia regenti]|nr:unnamed protein product [Trichobilharzia regenti]